MAFSGPVHPTPACHTALNLESANATSASSLDTLQKSAQSKQPADAAPAMITTIRDAIITPFTLTAVEITQHGTRAA